MYISRIGKIARLPHDVREQLNRRLQNAQLGPPILEWLNALPEVQAVLQQQFAGQPVSKQNLSQWRRGGYLDWLRRQQLQDLIPCLAAHAKAVEEAVSGAKIGDQLSTALAFQLVYTAQILLSDASEPKQRWRTLRGVLQELGRIRFHDHQQVRLRFDRARWAMELAQARQEQAAAHPPKDKNHPV
ncbi:MAG: hypothetical protein NTW03_00265 [Verrucomicrobia bacterium]|nr:hypothetical protein [Verrucomicrobiota bacterium]